MAKSKTEEILVDIQAEAKTQGATELGKLAEGLIQIAGAGNVAAESVQYLEYVLTTLKSSKGMLGIGEISTSLRNSFNQFKSIKEQRHNKKISASEEKKKTSTLYQDTVVDVARKKTSRGKALTTEETLVVRSLEQVDRAANEVAQSLYDTAKKILASTSLIEDPARKAQLYTDAAKAFAGSTEALNASSKRGYFTATAATNAEKARGQKRMNDWLKANNKDGEYAEAQFKIKKLNAALKELEFESKRRKALKDSDLVGNPQAQGWWGRRKLEARSAFMGVENNFEASHGLKGMFARSWGRRFKGTRLGDMFNMGLEGAGVNFGTIAGGAFGMSLAKLGKAFIQLTKDSLEAYSNIEKVRTGLGVVYGTQGEADSVFGEIAQYAIKSPFGVKETADQAVLLKQSGVADYELMDVLKMVGDLAGGNQDKMVRISNALSQISSNETAQARQLKSFTMAGIPIYEALSKVLGTSNSEVREKVRKNEVSYDDILKAFKVLTGEGGSFYQSVEKGSRTYGARKTNLQDIAELAKAEYGEVLYRDFGRVWLEIQEGFWSGFKDFWSSSNLRGKVNIADKTEDKLDYIDSLIGNKDGLLTPQEVQQLKVYRMEVENMATYNKEQREQIYAQNYEAKTAEYKEFEAEFQIGNKIFGDIDRYYKKLNELNPNTDEFKRTLEFFNAAVAQAISVGIWSGSKNSYQEHDIMQKSGYGVSDVYLDIAKSRGNFMQSGKRGRRDYDSVTSGLWTLGDETANYTREEKAMFGVAARKSVALAREKTADLARGTYSTDKRLADVYALWEKSDSGKAAKEQEEKELIEGLKALCDEIETLNLNENKFGYLSKSNGYSSFLTNTERYLDVQNARELDLTNQEDIKMFQETLSQLQGSLIGWSSSEIGEKKSLESLMNRALNAGVDGTVLYDLITRIDALIMNLKGVSQEERENMKKTWDLTKLDIKARQIDRNKLNQVENGKKIDLSRDKDYAPLIRQLTDSILNVSLYRTIGAPLGMHEGDTYQNGSLVNNVTRYVENEFDRNTSAAIASALLKQTAKEAFSWFDISENIVQSSKEYQKRKNQVILDDEGKLDRKFWTEIIGGKEVQKTNSTGRYQKGFIEQPLTRQNLEFAALGERGSAQAAIAVRDSYAQMVNKLDEFFVKSFTAKEEFEEKAEIQDAKREYETELAVLNAGLASDMSKSPDSEKGGLRVEYDKNVKKLQEQYNQKVQTALFTALGVEENIEYRERVTALAHEIKKASDGTKKYTEVYLEALHKYREELKEMETVSGTIANFKQALEQTTAEIKELNEELSKPWFSDPNSEEAAKDKNIRKFVNDEKNKVVLEKAGYGNWETDAIISDLGNYKPTTGTSLADIVTQKENLKEGLVVALTGKPLIDLMSDATKIHEDLNDTTVESAVTNLLKGLTEDDKKGILDKFKQQGFLSKKATDNIDSGKYTSPDQLDFRQFSDEALRANPKWSNDFKSTTSIRDAINIIAEYIAQKEYNSIDQKPLYKDALVNQINAQTDADANKNKLTKELEWKESRNEIYDQYNQNFKKATGFSLFTDDFKTYGDETYKNTGKQQRILNYYGAEKGTAMRDWAFSMVSDVGSDGKRVKSQSKISDFNKTLEELGLDTKFKLDVEWDEEKLASVIEKFHEFLMLENETEKKLVELGTAMKDSFKSFALDSISSTMEIMGKNFVKGTDATEELGQNMRDLAANMLSTIGPLMTKTGLEIAAGAAGASDWGKVAMGLGLAAAGGFLSWGGGVLSGIGDKDDEDAQKEERLKSLADLLSDLIDQARIDAEYYERNLRHTKALSVNEISSNRSVNDAVITPSGEVITTHPDDWLIATKTPETLGGKQGAPTVTITIVNQSGDNVKVASTEQKIDENGDIDVKAMIIAVTADAVANGEMDGAFAQMQARQKGISNSF